MKKTIELFPIMVGDPLIRVLGEVNITGKIIREDDEHWYFTPDEYPSAQEINARLSVLFNQLGLEYTEIMDPNPDEVIEWKFLKSTLTEVDEELGWDGIYRTGSYLKQKI